MVMSDAYYGPAIDPVCLDYIVLALVELVPCSDRAMAYSNNEAAENRAAPTSLDRDADNN